MVVVENCGVPLYDFMKRDWHERAFLTYQLLDLAESFSFNNKDFKLYLTDISPDNIVVNTKDLRIFVVDLGNAILQRRFVNESTEEHYSEHFFDDEYAFSKKEICKQKISDHNIYAVCRLLISNYATYPMSNGLLHSPPKDQKNRILFNLIEACVYSTHRESRFEITKQIKKYLTNILVKKDYFRSYIRS